VEVIAALIKCGLVNVLALDEYLAKQIESEREQIVEFAVKLIHRCMCVEEPFVTHTEFFQSLDLIAKLHSRDRIPDEYDISVSADDIQTDCERERIREKGTGSL
jgi:hypothetical protein